MLLHYAFHTSVHIAARLTVGVCFFAEIIILVKYLNKCLRFEVTFTSNFLTWKSSSFAFCAASVVALSCFVMKIKEALSPLNTEETLLVCLPSVYVVIILFKNLFKERCSSFSNYLYNFSLIALLCVYW